MTAYQRGNRDGLLSFAAKCDGQARQALEQAESWDAARHSQAPRLAELWHARAAVWLYVSDIARAAAESLPIDPEGT